MLTVSVVIPTLNREAALGATLSELLRTPPSRLKQIIVVDQSDIPSALFEFEKNPLVFYRWVAFRNLPQARNYGTSLATGDIVLFLDDDVEGLQNIVDAHADAQVRLGGGAATGPILDPGGRLRGKQALSNIERAALEQSREADFSVDFGYSPLFAAGGNMSYPRAVLANLGGFDENFLGSAVGEDAEMTHRARRAGVPILYEPSAALVHLHLPSGNQTDELQATEISVLNAHYYATKTAQPVGAAGLIWLIFRTRVFNRKTLASTNVSVLWTRTLAILRAAYRAPRRTRQLARKVHQ